MPEFNREQVIKDLWHSPDVSAAIGKMEPEELRDDLRQEMFLVLCEMDECKLRGLHERGELRWYLVGAMCRMIKSSSGQFYIQFRKFADLCRPDIMIGCDGMQHRPRDFDSQRLRSSGGTYKNMIQPKGLIHEDEQPMPLTERLRETLQAIDPYEADMIRLYAEMGRNCQPVAKATGIQVRSVRYVVTAAKTKLKKKLREAI